MIINGLYVEVNGNQNGIPILFIHGGGGAIWTWKEVIPFLDDFRCILVDLPEHGKTGVGAGDFTISSASAKMAELIRTLLPEGKANVVGLSVGGQMVVEMLAKTPEVINSAIVSSAQLFPMPGDNLGFYSKFVMDTAYWMAIAPFKNFDPWIRLNMKYSAGIPDRYFEIFKENFQSLTLGSWSHVMVDNFRYRIPAGLEKVNLPVLLLAGTKEYGSIHDSHNLLARTLSNNINLQVGESKNWSMAQEHNWPMNDPELFAEVVRAWVLKKPLPPGLKLIENRG
jgi:pimeloyl-ACP methyl ester carboxylesterase